MSTRSERLERHKRGEEARARLKSGDYVQAQESGPYQSTRAKALASYKPPDTTSGHTPEPIDIVKPGQSFNPLQGTMDRVKSIAQGGQSAPYEPDPIKRGAANKQLFEPKTLPGMLKIPQMNYETNYVAPLDSVINFGKQFTKGSQEAVLYDEGKPVPTTGSKKADKVARFIGNSTAGLATGQTELNALNAVGHGAESLAAKVAPGLVSRLTGTAAEGAAQGVVGGAMLGQTSPKELATNAATGAGLGALGRGLVEGASGVASKLNATARNLTETNPVYKTMVSQIGEDGARAQVGKQALNDIDSQLNTLNQRNSSAMSVTERAAHNDNLDALNNDRSATVDYIKQYEPEFTPRELTIQRANDVPSSTTPETITPAAAVPQPEVPLVAASPQSTRSRAMAANTQPTNVDQGLQQRGFVQTLQESEKPPQGFKDRLQSAYKPITNEGTLAAANKRLNKDVEEATSFVLGNSRFTAEKATTAQRLIDHYNSTGNYQRAVDVAQKVSEEATRAGQSIQALSMFNKLTPEGVLIHAQRIASKVNEKTSIFAKEAKVTPEIAADIKGLASKTQEMTGIKDLSNNVNDILDRAKAGEKLSDSDAATLKRFVNESKQFVEETTKKPKPPKAPAQPKDKRVRDNVTSFLDAQEQAAKQRLRARGIQVSSTPLDTWADYAIIGASKMAKGAIKFTDWSEQMVKDLGESIRPNLNQLYDRARQAYEESTKKVSAQTISTAEKLTEKVIKTKQLAPAEADSLRQLAQKVSGLSGDAKITASQDLQVILQGLERPGVLKKISTAQTLGQLLNPKTQVRNAFGNELFYRLERVNKFLSTPIDIARSKLTGGDRAVTFRTNNQGEYWKNWLRGAQAGWKGVNVNGLETQYDLAGQTFRGKYNPLTYLEKTLGVALKSFDTAAYMRAYNDTLGEQATLRLVNEGKKATKENVQKYIREADDNMKTIADEYGKYVTFQDNNIISKGLVALKKGLNVGKDFGAGDLILKYPKTPGALLMRALEYSPAGFVRSAAILTRPLMKKEANTAEVTQALTRAIIGTVGLSGMGYFLLDKGVLTGAASKDKDIKGLQQSAGQGQYQVNLSALMRLAKSGFDSASAKLRQGDELYTYDWMQPVSIAISIGANTAKNLNEGKQSLKGLAGTVYNSLEGGLGTLTEQSVLSGLKQAAQGYPGQTVTDKILDIVSDIPASFVPTAANQVKQLQDNARRETYSPNKLEQSLNYAQSKVPGLAQKLPQQYDTLGKPKETYQDNSLFNVLLNPGFSSKYELSPEAKYIVDLITESDDETLAPRVPGKTITVDGQSIKLNGDQFSRIQQLQGEETRKRIAQRAERDSNKKLDTRSKNVTKSLTDAGKAARKQLTKELGNK